MQFKTDENIPREAVALLQAAGYDAWSVFEQSLSGQPDNRIAAVCKRENRVLITLDTDFADIRTYRPGDYPGLLVLRLARQSTPEVLRIIRSLLEVLRTSDCRGQLWIVEPGRIRVRA